MISYKPFFITLAELNMQKDDVRKKTNISSKTMAKISQDPAQRQDVSLSVLNKICWALGDIPIEKVIEYVPDKETSKTNPTE